jgi:hypothetical protein
MMGGLIPPGWQAGGSRKPGADRSRALPHARAQGPVAQDSGDAARVRLKPCPCCDGPAQIVWIGAESSGRAICLDPLCRLSSGKGRTFEDIAARWNRRASEKAGQ